VCVLGFKHPASKHVHEHYLMNQRVDTTEKAFIHYKNMMQVQFGIVITERQSLIETSHSI
jgi:hypothetical protein